MKKYLAIFSFCAIFISGSVFADKTPHSAHFFIVSIYNNMSINCDLQSSSLFYGKVFGPAPIPAYLAPGSVNQFTLLEGNNTGATVRLTYECEGGSSVTIFSRSNLNFRNRTNQIRHYALNPVNMQAVVTKAEQSFLNNFSVIYWVFQQ